MNIQTLKESWQTFNWRFWQNDGMRDVSENEELDPHYLEMLKVSYLCGSPGYNSDSSNNK